MKTITFSLFFTATLAIWSLPPLSGPEQIGKVALKLVDHGRIDELAPKNETRDRALLVNLYYPASDIRRSPVANYSTPAVAAALDRELMLNTPLFEQIRTRAYVGAKIKKPYPPVVLFSTGMFECVETYQAMVEDLASKGYIVAAIDHTYDTPVVEFPDGEVVLGTPLINDTSPLEDIVRQTRRVQQVRVKDALFVLNQLASKHVMRKIPGTHGQRLNTYKVGMFGHSLGGSTAADVMLADPRVIAGINLDGSFVGDAAAGTTIIGGPAEPHNNADLKRPFLIMGADIRFHNRTEDPTWAAFWQAQTGWKRNFHVQGASHHAYSDYTPLVDILDLTKLLPKAVIQGYLGPVNGTEMHKIVTSYVGAFFDFAMKGKQEELLDGPSEQFPNVVFAA